MRRETGGEEREWRGGEVKAEEGSGRSGGTPEGEKHRTENNVDRIQRHERERENIKMFWKGGRLHTHTCRGGGRGGGRVAEQVLEQAELRFTHANHVQTLRAGLYDRGGRRGEGRRGGEEGDEREEGTTSWSRKRNSKQPYELGKGIEQNKNGGLHAH